LLDVSEISLLERLSDSEVVKKCYFTLKPETSLTFSTEHEKLYFSIFTSNCKW